MSRTFGVEMELSGFSSDDLDETEDLVPASRPPRSTLSIGNDGDGAEVRLGFLEREQMPYIQEVLNRMYEAFPHAPKRVNTRACGLHVHWDTREWGLEKYLRFFGFWLAIEPWVRNRLPIDVARQCYCEPWREWLQGRATEAEQYQAYYASFDGQIRTIMRAGRRPQLQAFWHPYMYPYVVQFVDPGKYRKAISPHSHHHTVEFRMHNGTNDYGQIDRWVRFTGCLIEHAADLDAGEVLDLYDAPIASQDEWMASFLQRHLRNEGVELHQTLHY